MKLARSEEKTKEVIVSANGERDKRQDGQSKQRHTNGAAG